MNANRALAASAVASFLGLILATPSGAADDSAAPVKRPPHEKCYGIAKKGQNDCSTATHSCSNESTSDGGAGEWLWVPKGTCAKIVGGVLETAPK
ncbi:MAG TPA: DUF2282 domain-containing protein [Myxococcota bacterium]|nr:DUF2282 domain-containing protein [Myxococcota bacterium]